jgi:hypothetical protein
MSITPEQARAIGRTAAHASMTEAQVVAIMQALDFSPTGKVTERAIRAYRLRLIWIAEGMGDVNEADPTATDDELNAALGHPTSYLDI